MKLNDYSKLTATLVLKSGLHIGTGEKTGAGEPSPILISRRTELPYIPGSSIKGRMRCLLEQTYEDNLKKNPNDSGSVCFCGKCQICYLFGGGDAQIAKQPTRLLFRDSYLKEESESIIEKKGLEEKPGIRIDRSTGKSPKGAFFFVERVPEGCKFELEIAVRVFDGDNTEGVQQWLAMGLYLMEKDAIGGGGSPGSGWVEFTDIKFDEKSFEANWRDISEKAKNNLWEVKITSAT